MLFGKILFGSVLAALGHTVVSQGAPVGEKSYILDKGNFFSKTSSGTWIVKHYSPQCMHCLNFQPKWEKVVADNSLPFHDKDIHFGEINCIENAEQCEKNKVLVWPTVLVLKNGKSTATIEGDNTVDEFASFVKRSVADELAHGAPPATSIRKYKANSVILNANNFAEAIKEGVWVVKHYSPTCPHCMHMAPEWIKVTDELAQQMSEQGVTFGEIDCMANRKTCEDNDVKGFPTINLYIDGRYIEETTDKYRYENMKSHMLNLPARIKAGEFDKKPAKSDKKGSGDNGWDDAPAEGDSNAKNDSDSEQEVVYNQKGKVVALTKENIAELTANGPWFIKFYAPWCGHCQHLAPTWIDLAQTTKGKVNIGEINCDDEGVLCSKYKVQSYPSLKMVWEGQITEFKGARDLDSMVAFVEKSLAKPHLVKSAMDVQQAQKEHEVVYVLAHDEADTSARTKSALTHIKANAQKMFLSPQLYIVNDPSIARTVLKVGKAELPVLAALKDDRIVKYEGMVANDDQLYEWFHAERFPLLPELSRENSELLFYDTDYLVLTIFDTGSGSDYMAHYRDVAKAAAVNYSRAYGSGALVKAQNTLRFAWVDGDKWASYIDRVFRISKSSWPAVVIVQPSEDQFFTTDARGKPIELAEEEIAGAIRAVFDGKLKPQSTNSMIVRGAHGLMWALNASWMLMFGTLLRTLASFVVLCAIGRYLYKRSQEENKPEASHIAKAD